MALAWNQIPASVCVCVCVLLSWYKWDSTEYFLLNSEAQSRQNRRMSQSFSKSEVVCFHLLSGTGVGKMLVNWVLFIVGCTVQWKKRRNYSIWELYAKNNVYLLCKVYQCEILYTRMKKKKTWEMCTNSEEQNPCVLDIEQCHGKVKIVK